MICRDMNARYNKGDNGKNSGINLLRGRSANKIITGARNSIKRQSRYLSAGALCHNRQGLSPVARASKTRTRSTLLSPPWIQACARAVHIFFNPPSRGFLSAELSTEAIASPDEIFSHLALPFLPLLFLWGNGCKKYFAKTVAETTLFPDAQVFFFFFLNKGKGEGNSSVITLNAPLSVIERV